VITLPFTPWAHQRDAHEKRKRFTVLVWHRRAGKTVFAVLEAILAALDSRVDRARFAYVAPFYRQAKAVAWEYLKHYARPVPGTEILEAELTVRFANGASVRLFGADNPDSLRGLYFDGVVLDEVADMRSEVWGEIIRPALTDRQGWALFIGTPKGINLFSDLYQRASVDEGWYSDLRRASDTGSIPIEELERARREMSPAQYAQEMDCDFSAAVVNALVPLELALAATKRDVNAAVIIQAPKVMGVDVARYGDDRSVIAKRQGQVAFQLQTCRNLDTMEFAGQVARVATEWKPDAIFVDEGGIGAGVYDRLAQLGYPVLAVSFGSKAIDDRYENKRMEMWALMAEWLRLGCLPDDHELVRELTAPTFSYANARGRQQLESKDDLRERLKCSPDKADALALTFASPVSPAPRDDWGMPMQRQTRHEKTWQEAR
jgi:hypothetical protein